MPKNSIEAYAWASIAAAQGNEMARVGEREIAGSMFTDELARAHRLARGYVGKIRAAIPKVIRTAVRMFT